MKVIFKGLNIISVPVCSRIFGFGHCILFVANKSLNVQNLLVLVPVICYRYKKCWFVKRLHTWSLWCVKLSWSSHKWRIKITLRIERKCMLTKLIGFQWQRAPSKDVPVCMPLCTDQISRSSLVGRKMVPKQQKKEKENACLYHNFISIFIKVWFWSFICYWISLTWYIIVVMCANIWQINIFLTVAYKGDYNQQILYIQELIYNKKDKRTKTKNLRKDRKWYLNL
jgi:hypothetical protein